MWKTAVVVLACIKWGGPPTVADPEGGGAQSAHAKRACTKFLTTPTEILNHAPNRVWKLKELASFCEVGLNFLVSYIQILLASPSTLSGGGTSPYLGCAHVGGDAGSATDFWEHRTATGRLLH